MILNEVFISLDKIDEFFLEHREGVDPENYRVGKIDDKVIIYNPDTQKFMEYFYDDKPEIEWFSLEFIDNRFSLYEINREGDIRNKNSKFVLSNGINECGYPRVSMFVDNKNKRIFTHVALGKIFIPNIDLGKNKIIDHINRIRDDYSLNNLRWVSFSEKF